MSLWKKLFGFPASPPTKTNLDAIKQIARQNEERQRAELERTPRLSDAEIASQAKRLRSINQLAVLYSELRHADFCDVVAAAVRTGNFSNEDEVSFALIAREWVRTGNANRTSLPEWAAKSGRDHMLKLNRDWLKSGVDRRTTFHQWLVGADTDKSKEKTSTVVVEGIRWKIEKNTLTRFYKFSGLPPPETTASLKITFYVGKYETGLVYAILTFYLRPYRNVLPEGVPYELVKAPFTVSLFAAGSGAGTEKSPLMRGGIFDVQMCATEEPDTVLLRTEDEASIDQFVTAICSGEDLTFTIMGKSIPKFQLTLPNDFEFTRLYSELRRSLA
jgi:hypothetical protein